MKSSLRRTEKASIIVSIPAKPEHELQKSSGFLLRILKIYTHRYIDRKNKRRKKVGTKKVTRVSI